MTTAYNCAADVMAHKERVKFWLNAFANLLKGRAEVHDDSKLKSPEKETFDKWTPELKRVVFGSPEYKAALAGMGEGLKHHYQNNRHHPEHFARGVSDMTLLDVLEMYCDWLAAAQAKGAPVDLDHLTERFGLSPQLRDIFLSTLRDDDYWNAVNGVPVGYFTPEHYRGQLSVSESERPSNA